MLKIDKGRQSLTVPSLSHYNRIQDFEQGSGSVAMISLCFVLFLTLGLILSLVSFYVDKQSTVRYIEQAALQGADAARGKIDSTPCTQAKKILERQKIQLTNCQVSGDLMDVVDLRGSKETLFGIEIDGQARAGSPEYRYGWDR